MYRRYLIFPKTEERYEKLPKLLNSATTKFIYFLFNGAKNRKNCKHFRFFLIFKPI